MDDYEYRVSIPKMLLPEYPEPRITICVSKVGGGTVGQAYKGTWEYRVRVNGATVTAGHDLRTGTASTHEEAARVLAGFLCNYNYPALEGQFDRLYLFSEDDLEGDDAQAVHVGDGNAHPVDAELHADGHAPPADGRHARHLQAAVPDRGAGDAEPAGGAAHPGSDRGAGCAAPAAQPVRSNHG